MAELRKLLSELGLRDVATHLQSGNAIFRDPGVVDLADKIDQGMKRRFGFQPALFLIQLDNYRDILESNTYQEIGAAFQMVTTWLSRRGSPFPSMPFQSGSRVPPKKALRSAHA